MTEDKLLSEVAQIMEQKSCEEITQEILSRYDIDVIRRNVDHMPVNIYLGSLSWIMENTINWHNGESND
jgi:hypothetical protein